MAKTQFTKTKQHLSPKRLLAALVALVAVFLLLTSVVSVAQKYFATRRHIKELEQEKLALEEKQQSLKEMNDYLATSAGTEQVLRQKYNVVKPGEGIIVVADTDTTVPQVEHRSTVRRWWDAILSGLGVKKD